MSSFFKIGLVVCLGASSSWLVGCGDDSSSDADSGVTHRDGGTVVHLDSSVPSIDSGLVDAATGHDAASGDAATATVYNVTLSAAQEAPSVCAMAGASATGAATVTVSADKSTITVHETYSNLSSAVSGAHIHFGAPGVSGGVVLPFSVTPLTSPIDQTLTAANYVAVSGAPATFAGFIDSLKAGNSYLNLHTAKCADGEIRGQIK